MTFAVDEGAEPRLLVADDAAAVLDGDLGVDARDVGARQAQIGLAAAADGEQRLVDVDDAPAERVGDHETGSGSGVGHEERDYSHETRESTRKRCFVDISTEVLKCPASS